MSLLLEQVSTFLLLVLVGIGMAIIFDIYRVLRGQLNPPKLISDLMDLFIWIFLSLLTFAVLVFGNWGEVRVYIFIGLIFGLIIYFKWFSKTIIKIVFNLYKAVRRVILMIFKIIIFPIKLLGKLFAPFKPIGGKFKVIWGRIKLRLHRPSKKD